MPDPQEEAARTALVAAADDLEEICRRLQSIAKSLPVSAEEVSLRDLDGDPTPATEMRTVIQNVLANGLRTEIEDLRAAAAYRHETPAQPQWNLAVYNQETQQMLYDLVVKENFTAKPLADPGDIWIPPYTPEEAELRVYFERGRWFATWQQLDVPASLPDAERWEFLRLEEDPANPGSLIYHEV